jgi:DNA-binding NtrC family response regulator
MSVMSLASVEPETEFPETSVLVAEDEVLIRAVLAQHLRGAGFRILEASNAREAMDILNSGEKVGVLFTDVRMLDEKDGIRLAQWVRQNYPSVRIVFGSGERNLDNIVPGAKLFSKPYDFDQVENFIRGLLADSG